MMREHEDMIPDFSLADLRVLADMLWVESEELKEREEIEGILPSSKIYTSSIRTKKTLLYSLLLASDGGPALYPEGWYVKNKVPEILLEPYKSLPLRINEDKETSIIAKWRLKVGK